LSGFLAHNLLYLEKGSISQLMLILLLIKRRFICLHPVR
jgi:hypothetical protein